MINNVSICARGVVEERENLLLSVIFEGLDDGLHFFSSDKGCHWFLKKSKEV